MFILFIHTDVFICIFRHQNWVRKSLRTEQPRQAIAETLRNSSLELSGRDVLRWSFSIGDGQILNLTWVDLGDSLRDSAGVLI